MNNHKADKEGNRSSGDVNLEENVKNTMDSKKDIKVMEEVRQARSLINRIRKRQSVFISHMMTRQEFQHLITMESWKKDEAGGVREHK